MPHLNWLVFITLFCIVYLTVSGWLLLEQIFERNLISVVNLCYKRISPEVVFIYLLSRFVTLVSALLSNLNSLVCQEDLNKSSSLSPTVHLVPALSPSTTRLSKQWWVWLGDTFTAHLQLACFFPSSTMWFLCTFRIHSFDISLVWSLFTLFRTWWRVIWCTLFARRWRCWKNTSRSCMRGTLSWSVRTLCWSHWLILSSLASFPVNSFIAAAAARRFSSSSSSTPRSSPHYHSLRGVRLSAISPTSHLRDSPLNRTCAKTCSTHGQQWEILLAMQHLLPPSPLCSAEQMVWLCVHLRKDQPHLCCGQAVDQAIVLVRHLPPLKVLFCPGVARDLKQRGGGHNLQKGTPPSNTQQTLSTAPSSLAWEKSRTRETRMGLKKTIIFFPPRAEDDASCRAGLRGAIRKPQLCYMLQQ